MSNNDPAEGRRHDNHARGRRICSWCRRDMGMAMTDDDTHGICPACYDRELSKLNNDRLKPPGGKPK